jgi:hypothetical protein
LGKKAGPVAAGSWLKFKGKLLAGFVLDAGLLGGCGLGLGAAGLATLAALYLVG